MPAHSNPSTNLQSKYYSFCSIRIVSSYSMRKLWLRDGKTFTWGHSIRQAVGNLGSHQVSCYKPLLLLMSCATPCNPVSNNYIFILFCFVFQELRSKQTQLSQMEYLQTGALRTSEIPRESGQASVDIHNPLTQGTKPECREEGIWFGSGLEFLRRILLVQSEALKCL